jgi:coenzyme F420-reducing hydrogenase alpha subunit
MSKETIVIEPVTRIEGHAKITIDLDENKKCKNSCNTI